MSRTGENLSGFSWQFLQAFGALAVEITRSLRNLLGGMMAALPFPERGRSAVNDRHALYRSVAVLAAVVAVLYLCWKILQPFAMVLAWAGVLAVVFHPVYCRIERRLKRPNLAAFATLSIAVLFVILPLTLLTVAVVREAASLSGTVETKARELVEDPRSGEWLGRAEEYAKRWIDVDHVLTADGLSKFLGKVSQVVLQSSVRVVGGALGLIVDLTFVVFALFFLLRDGARLVQWLSEVPAWGTGRAGALVERIRETVDASVYGVLTIALIQGALGTVIFLILGVPSAILWGVLMTVSAILPMVGPSLVWIPIAVVLAATGHPTKAAILVGWGVLVIGTIDNFLRPSLIGSRAKLHDLVVFFAVLGGLKMFGLIGFVLGPVIVAVGIGLLDAFREAGTDVAAPAPVSSVEP